MDPLDRLLLKMNFAWLLILQYFARRETILATGTAIIIISLLLINRKN